MQFWSGTHWSILPADPNSVPSGDVGQVGQSYPLCVEPDQEDSFIFELEENLDLELVGYKKILCPGCPECPVLKIGTPNN